MAISLVFKPERFRYRCYMSDRGIDIYLVEPEPCCPTFRVMVFVDGNNTPLRVQEVYTLCPDKASDAFLATISEFRQNAN